MLRRNLFIGGTILVLGSIAVTASAQGPRGGGLGGGMFRGGGSASMLMGIEEVQKELNLSDDQKKQINTLLTDARAKVLGQINFQDLQNLSGDEREKRITEMRKKFEDLGKGIDEKVGSLLDAKQAERLHQLLLQREGAMALSRPEVIKKLDLSEDQQAKIKKIQEDARPTGRPAFGANQSNEERQAAFQKMREQFEKAQKESFAVLNDDQMLDWTNMCGKTFKFPERPAFGRGNRQRPKPAPAP